MAGKVPICTNKRVNTTPHPTSTPAKNTLSKRISNHNTSTFGTLRRQDSDESATLKKTFYFLMERKVPELRSIAQACNVKQGRLKNQLIVNLISHVQNRSSNDKALEAIFGVEPCRESFHVFSRTWTSIEKLRVDPDWASLMSIPSLRRPHRRRSRYASTDINSQVQTPFSNFEFAWLLLILVHEKLPRDALLSSNRRLPSQQLENQVSRDAFWDTVVAKTFNDPPSKCVLRFHGLLDRVKVEKTPLQSREGSLLKEMFDSNRKVFSLAYQNWSRSGQKETDNFSNFVPTVQGAVTTASVRAMLTFEVLRCDQPDKDTELLNFMLHQANGSSGKDHECGMPDFNYGYCEKKKRKRSSLNTEAYKTTGVLQKSSRQLKPILSYTKESMSRPPTAIKERQRMEKLEQRQKLLQMMADCEKILLSAPQDAENLFKKALEAQRNGLVKEFYTLSEQMGSEK